MFAVANSEGVVVCSDVPLDLIECFKALENAVLENCFELVLNTCQDGDLFVFIEAKLLECLAPVEFVKVKQFEGVNDLTNPCLYLGLVEESFAL